jgi:hypothetical protein
MNKKMNKKLRYHVEFHDNCLDYLAPHYIKQYSEERYQKFLIELSEKIPIINFCQQMDKINYNKTIVCDQHAIIMTHDKDPYPYISTYALNACIGLILYEPQYHLGVICHFDGLPGFSQRSANEDGIIIDYDPFASNMKNVIDNLNYVTLNTIKHYNFDSYLIGGVYGLSETMIHDMYQYLNNNFSDATFNFVGRNLLGPDNESRNIALSTLDGKLYYFDYVENYIANNGNGNIITAPHLKNPVDKNYTIMDITYLPVKRIYY